MFTLFFKRILALFFKRPSIMQLVDEQLYEANLDLLKAETCLEYWEHNAAMLRVRKTRLESRLKLEVANCTEAPKKIVSIGPSSHTKVLFNDSKSSSLNIAKYLREIFVKG